MLEKTATELSQVDKINLTEFAKEVHKIGAGNPLVPKGGWEECDCRALNCLTKLVIIF